MNNSDYKYYDSNYEFILEEAKKRYYEYRNRTPISQTDYRNRLDYWVAHVAFNLGLRYYSRG